MHGCTMRCTRTPWNEQAHYDVYKRSIITCISAPWNKQASFRPHDWILSSCLQCATIAFFMAPRFYFAGKSMIIFLQTKTEAFSKFLQFSTACLSSLDAMQKIQLKTNVRYTCLRSVDKMYHLELLCDCGRGFFYQENESFTMAKL